MKRAALARKTPLKPGKPIARASKLPVREKPEGKAPLRKSKLRQVNPKRRAEKHLRNFDGGIDHDTYIRSLPCCWCEAFDIPLGIPQSSPTQAAHVVARGMGGAKGAWFDTVPMCDRHHRLQEKSDSNARSFLGRIAARLAVQHLAAKTGVDILFPNPETGRL